jgi:formate hydrogenlyase subunit 3/multisubunit Na+/H+ antiporter MnhD subunit
VGGLIAVLLLVESMIAFGFFLWLGQRVFFGEPSAAAERADSGAPMMGAVVIVLAILCLVVPIFAFPLIQYIPLGM